jgi:hypothetical protein
MESRQKADPEFFYDFQLDGEGHLKTMFGVIVSLVWTINPLVMLLSSTVLTE